MSAGPTTVQSPAPTPAGPASKATLVEIKGLSHSYGKGDRAFNAIQDINLTIQEGDFVALVGPSGCGKSTLLRIITGLQQPSIGNVVYRGVPLTGVNPKSTIVFQSFALFPWLTVAGNIDRALKVRGVPQKQREERTQALLTQVGLEGFDKAYPRELSGGMRQKVGFARAMAVEPELLCLDEPFSALDVLSAQAIRTELIQLWTSGKIPTKAILMVTHNIEEAVLMADRIVAMDKGPGRIVAELKVSLPQPRDRKDPRFIEVVDRVYAQLAGQTQPEVVELGSAPGEGKKVRALPNVSINDLIGFVDYLNDLPTTKTDIYKLVELLKIDTNKVLLLTDACELMGFATVAQGDITLTPLGETFAEATVTGRKAIFAARIRKLPLFSWLIALLQVADEPRLKWDTVEAELMQNFPPEEATVQLTTVVDWGRYADILAYDDTNQQIYLDMPDVPDNNSGQAIS